MELKDYFLALLIALVLAGAFFSYVYYSPPTNESVGLVQNQTTLSLEEVGENKALLTDEEVGIKFSRVRGFFKLEVVLPKNVGGGEVYDKIELDLISDKSAWNFTLPIWRPKFNERLRDVLSLRFDTSDIDEMERLVNESRSKNVKLILYFKIVDFSKSSLFISSPPLPLHEVLLETEKNGKFSGYEEFSIYDAHWSGEAKLFRDNNLIAEEEIVV
ncbi:hypothetical protein DRN63_02980 [Nanoarchaeota archaeon]|nr:MAG: hypothetical protein DRN63_02980 [Nanoarchaeota archaeon]